jgi:Fic family protein
MAVCVSRSAGATNGNPRLRPPSGGLVLARARSVARRLERRGQLALYQRGHEVGRYVSTERLIEDSREDYYDALYRSSEGWHSGRHDLLPWLGYFLSIVRRAYLGFEERAGDVRAPRGAKTRLVLDAVERFGTPFAIAELERKCPGVSRDMVRRVLRDLKAQGAVSVTGHGPGARWSRRGTTPKKG